MNDDLPTMLARLRGLFEIAALPEAPANRAAGLAEIARTIGDALGYETVAINLLRPAWDDFEVVAVHGDPRAREALLGTTTTADEWAPLLVERFYRRGAYYIRHGEFDWDALGQPSYVPDRAPAPAVDAWHPEDALFVPMRDSSARLIGILSVDVPVSGRIPGDEQLDALVAVAAYAARAVESASLAASEAQRRHGLELLLDVSAKLARAPSVDEVLNSVCAGIRDALGFELVVIALADERDDRYHPLAAVGIPTGRDIELDVPIAQLDRMFDPAFEIEGCFLLPREEALVRVGVEPMNFQSTNNGTSPRAWSRHWLVVPLHAPGGRRIGFIWADEPRDRLLPSRPTLQALRTFANQAATALESARQREAIGRRTAELEALHETTLALLERNDPSEILETIVGTAAALVGVQNGFLYLVDPVRERLVLEIALGMFASYRGVELGRGEGLSGRVWVERKPLAVDNYGTWSARVPTYAGSRFCATAGIPLVVAGEVVGVIGVGDETPGRSFGEGELALLSRFGRLASLVLERAQLLRRLQEERDYSERLIESANALVIGVGADARIELFNQEAARTTGYSPDEAVGRSFLELLPAELFPEAEHSYTRALLEGTLPETFEAPLLAKDGARRLISWRTRAVFVDGLPRGVIGFGIDVTERHRLEEELRQSQKMEAVGRLAGGIAHDFNNLLTAITGYGELALAKLPDDEPVRENVFEMKRAGERAADLTRQLLAFSRRQVLQPEVMNVNTVVAELERMLRRLLGAQVELVTDLDPALGATKADPGQLEQVVMNLALNARDAMPRGGRLLLATRNEIIDGEPFAVLEVTDTGHGMDPATLEQAFEPFFTTKPVGEGTGLGLSTVYGIVKQSGGDVAVSSVPGSGTTVRVLLPRATEATSAGAGAPHVPARRADATILLVEDEDVVRGLLVTMLRDAGYRVIEAANGADAIAAAGDEPSIDLLLTDVVMPGLGGPELAETLLEQRPGLRVVFVSGYSADATERQRRATAGTAFLQKPFTRAQLISTLDSLLAEPISEAAATHR